jgi:Pectate lyase superfamily protein
MASAPSRIDQLSVARLGLEPQIDAPAERPESLAACLTGEGRASERPQWVFFVGVLMTDPIVKNFVTDFGAVADGTTDNSPALARWVNWGRAQGKAPVELYMPPGTYHFAGDANLTSGLYNVTISGYGASIDSVNAVYFGTAQLLQDDFAHSARIQTVSAGATSVNLITPADASKFSAGQWVLVSGLALQGGAGGLPSYPPNFQFFEYQQIVSISGSAVTLASPLANSYESTWPVVDSLQGAAVNVGGPATIYALGPMFDAQQTILGLEVKANATNDNGVVFMDAGRSLVMDGMKFDGLGPSPSVGQSVVIRNSYFGTNNEIDKVISYVEYDNDTGQQLVVQSAAPTTLVVNNSTFGNLIGTAQNTSIQRSTIGLLYVGPLAFGVGQSLSISNSNIATMKPSDLAINPSEVSFNNGTFRVATTSPNVADVYRWAVPGHKYFFAYYYGAIQATDDNGHITSFKVLDVRQDATYTYVDTDLGATLPAPTFLGGHPVNQYVAYPVMTVTEKNSGPAVFAIVPNPRPPKHTTANMILRGANTSSAAGQYEIYDIGNNAIMAAYSLGEVAADWAFVTLGSFNGTDTTDMLLRNNNTGAFEVYDISDNNITNVAALGTVGLNWQVAGFADFNRDGMTDMILRNSNTGTFEIYFISNNSIINAAASGTVGLNWQVGGFGNFSSLGESDMILRDTSTGTLEVYFNNNQSLAAAFMGTVGLEWQIIGVGNFSSNPGESDMMMRNTNTGGLEVYDIANNQITGAAFLGTVGLDWQFAGIAPVHAPGASDLVLRNVNTGAFEVYDIADNQLIGAAALGAVGLDWQTGSLAADPPTASTGSADGSTAQLVQAMAGFGGGSGAAESLSAARLGAETSQQSFLTMPHA